MIPALVRRVLEVEDVLEVWGSGSQTRSFLYVEDAARALLAAGEHLKTADPVNVGTDEEVTISELVDLIILSSGRKVEPRFDPSAPVGQVRKAADISKAKELLEWRPECMLAQGIQNTVDWYKKHGI